MGNYEQMKDEVRSHGGVYVTTLGDLRETIGMSRLGPFVLQDIARQLRQEGLAYFPADVLDANRAPRQGHQVRLVLSDSSSPIYKAVKAVEEPTDDGDAFLVDLGTDTPTATAARAEERLERVRGALEDARAILNEPDDAEPA